jgi:cytochrome c5
MRLLIVAVALFGFAGSAAAADQALVDRYNKTCAVCHNSGVAKAPKFGDAGQWKPHLDKGVDVLLGSVKNGLNAMPPKGMCFDCSDADYIALIEYMAAGK